MRCGRTEIPFLFFRPAEGIIAVYDPAIGTVTSECNVAAPAEVVALVAARLRYAVKTVRTEATPAASSTAM